MILSSLKFSLKYFMETVALDNQVYFNPFLWLVLDEFEQIVAPKL